MKFPLLLCALALLAACADKPEAARVAPALSRTPSAWVELTPQPVAIDGENVRPACSGAPGADPAFRFWAKRGASERLVIFFDGGGACWDDATCAEPRLASGDVGHAFYKAELMARDNPAQMHGIFELDNPRNPLRDWSFVFVPYCTGDVHTGSRTTTYHDPRTGAAYTLNHRGVDNFRLVLEWMRANFDNPPEILVTGSSAGAYGAAYHFNRIREAYPRGRAVFLGDAGQGVTTPGFSSHREANWGYVPPAGVNAGSDEVTQLAALHPGDRFAQYTTAHDETQVGFFALMRVREPCRVWTETMARDLHAREASPNFRDYLANGDTHTILRSPLLYTEQSAGQPFTDWLGALVSDSGAENRTCANCLTPPPACPF